MVFSVTFVCSIGTMCVVMRELNMPCMSKKAYNIWDISLQCRRNVADIINIPNLDGTGFLFQLKKRIEYQWIYLLIQRLSIR